MGQWGDILIRTTTNSFVVCLLLRFCSYETWAPSGRLPARGTGGGWTGRRALGSWCLATETGRSPLRATVPQLFTEETSASLADPYLLCSRTFGSIICLLGSPVSFLAKRQGVHQTEVEPAASLEKKITVVDGRISKVFELLSQARQIITWFLTEIWVSFWTAWHPECTVPRLP